MNTKSGLWALLLAVVVAVAAATADHDGDDARQLLRGKYWPQWGNTVGPSTRTSCGPGLPPQCCCIGGQPECRTPVCKTAAANGGKLPCGGGDFYTIGSEIVCKGSGNPVVNPNRGDEDDEGTVEVGDSEGTSTETSDDSAKCTIENWNLEGRGEEYSCESLRMLQHWPG